MPVTHVHKDPARHTMTVTAEFAASVERVWQIWADPRKLERWWGPPVYPATVVEHDLRPGGKVTYYMTGPEGDKPQGWWRVKAVEPPHRLEIEDGFGEDPDAPTPGMPIMIMRVSLQEIPTGTRMAIVTTFPSVEAMEQLIAMGMEEGMQGAMGQIDGVLGEG